MSGHYTSMKACILYHGSKRTESSLPPFRTKTIILKIKKFTPSRSRYFFTTSPSGSGRKGVSDGTSNGVWVLLNKMKTD